MEHFETERAREMRETEEVPEIEEQEVATIFQSYGLEKETVGKVVKAISADRKRWVDFMMRFELGLERPDPNRALASAATIAVSYIVGGLIPLSPYFVVGTIHSALLWSIGFTGIALLVFGAVKGGLTGQAVVKSSLQTLLVGGLAAGAAFFLASLFG